MQLQNILVTGAAGMVGSYVPDIFPDIDLTLTDITDNYRHLDIRDPQAVLQTIKELKPQIVLHLAAETDVDLSEKQPDCAYLTNAIGTQNVALACQKTGSLLVYISTAAVFPGDKKEPYTEFDNPFPSNIYADSKLQGEKIVCHLLDRFFICRTGWMMGGGTKDKKFVGIITKMMLEGKNQLQVVDDKFGSPIYAKDLLTCIRTLIETDYYGLYHIANTGMVSRHEIAVTIREILKIDNLQIDKISSAHHPLAAPRSSSEAINNYKLNLLGINKMRTWKEALEEYLLTDLKPSLLNQR
jgi:dTDP-4-dehydrorhamnose reductase